MKTLAILVSVLGLAWAGQGGETNQMSIKRLGAPSGPEPPAKMEFSTVSTTNSAGPLLRERKPASGVLPELGRRKAKILRARASPGRDFENVSVNPFTGKPEGIVLFSIGF